MKITAKEFQTKYNKRKESDIQADICTLLISKGFLVVRLNGGGVKIDDKRYFRAYYIKNLPYTYQSSGMPDVVAYKSNLTVFFEVKKNDKMKVSDSQERWIKLCKDYKVNTFVVSSLNEVIEILNKLENR
jgi:Holliday junction resolvase